LFQKVFYELYDVVNDETKVLYLKDMWCDFQCSNDYCGLKSRRAKQDYGRDELYKWLGKFKVFQTSGDAVKYAVGIVRKKCKSSIWVDDINEQTKCVY